MFTFLMLVRHEIVGLDGGGGLSFVRCARFASVLGTWFFTYAWRREGGRWLGSSNPESVDVCEEGWEFFSRTG